MSKICGECKHFEKAEYFCCMHGCDVATNSIACEDFESPTNGDRIRQGGDRALAEISIYEGQLTDSVKIYRSTLIKEKYWLSRQCAIRCVECLLNVSAESEVNNG